MKNEILYLSLVAVAALNAAEPMVSTSMSTDNGGSLNAIDAYSDGAGVVIYNTAGQAVVNNSVMNQLVFTYGDVAAASGLTIQQQAVVSGATLAGNLTAATLAVNPPPDGSSCDDGDPTTSNDIFMSGVCKGTKTSGKCDDGDQKTIDDVWHSDGSCYGNNVEGQKCSDGDFATINDVWHNGVCAGTNVENLYCDDQNDQTINDVWHNGVCAGMMVEGLSCDDGFSYTTGEKWHNGVCAGGTYAATGSTSYSCSAGTLSGQSCVGVITYSSNVATSTTNYTCPSGTLSGTSCIGATTYSSDVAASTMNYTCPNGGTLSGTTCTITGATQCYWEAKTVAGTYSGFPTLSGFYAAGDAIFSASTGNYSPTLSKTQSPSSTGSATNSSWTVTVTTDASCNITSFSSNDAYFATANISKSTVSVGYAQNMRNKAIGMQGPTPVYYAIYARVKAVTGASTYTATSSTTYSCPNGGTLSGANCLNVPTTSTIAATSSTIYSCPNGGTLSGTTCTK